MDVDKMFKLPALPSGAGNKRKFPDAPAPGESSYQQPFGTSSLPELLKRYRASDDTTSSAEETTQSNGKGKGKAATVGEEEEEVEYAPGQSSYTCHHSAN